MDTATNKGLLGGRTPGSPYDNPLWEIRAIHSAIELRSVREPNHKDIEARTYGYATICCFAKANPIPERRSPTSYNNKFKLRYAA